MIMNLKVSPDVIINTVSATVVLFCLAWLLFTVFGPNKPFSRQDGVSRQEYSDLLKRVDKLEAAARK
jgi:hypothetical protein